MRKIRTEPWGSRRRGGVRASSAYRAAGLLLVAVSLCSLFVVPFDYALAASLTLGLAGVGLAVVGELRRRGEV